MNNRNIAKSIGDRDDDYIEVSNQWAKAVVHRLGTEWDACVNDDVHVQCPTLERAMDHVFAGLAEFADGRCD